MVKKTAKGAHKMPGGMMMKDSEMRGGAKPKFGTPEFFASLKKGKSAPKKKTSKKRTRGGKK